MRKEVSKAAGSVSAPAGCGVFGDLGPAESEAVRALLGPEVRLAAHCDVRKAAGRRAEAFLLKDGWAFSSVELPDGGRQILDLHAPGTVMGATSLAFETPVETLTTLTPVLASPLCAASLGVLFEQAPRLAARLFLAAQEARAALADRLTAVGRLDAERSVTSLLLLLHERLPPADPPGAIPMPLTLTHMADALGLTPVHVSRVMRRMEKAGRLRRLTGRVVVLTDPAGLRETAGLPQRRPRRDPEWMPSRR